MNGWTQAIYQCPGVKTPNRESDPGFPPGPGNYFEGSYGYNNEDHRKPSSQKLGLEPTVAVVACTSLASGGLRGMRIQLVANAGAALVVLLVASALSV